MKKQTIKLNEAQLRNIIRESLNELDWKTYKNAANKRLAQGKYANANELSDMAKNRFDDEFNDNYRYDTLGAKLSGKHSKTFNSTFIPTEEPSLQGRNEKGEELFRNNGRYYNSRRGLTTPEKFFKDREMSDTFNTATQELDNYNSGNYDYTSEKGWHLKESQLRNIIKKSISEAVCEDEYDLPWTDRKPKNDMEKLRLSRYNGLVEIIEYYSAQEDDGKPLSKEQYEQLKNVCDTIQCFGEPGQEWAEFGREILSRNEHASINESQLRNIIKESVKKVLKENIEDPNAPYYWAIYSLRYINGELEAYSCYEDSSNSNDASKSEFATPQEAYQDGLKQLRYYDGDFELRVYYFTENGSGEYTDYMARIHDGKITEF